MNMESSVTQSNNNTGLTPAEVKKVQQRITDIDTALVASNMGDVKNHMSLLQQELQSTPYLANLLKPEELGILVMAERRQMEEDILASSVRAKPKSKKVKLGDLATMDLGDF